MNNFLVALCPKYCIIHCLSEIKLQLGILSFFQVTCALASRSFLKHMKHSLPWRSLHLLFSLPQILFSQIFTWPPFKIQAFV